MSLRQASARDKSSGAELQAAPEWCINATVTSQDMSHRASGRDERESIRKPVQKGLDHQELLMEKLAKLIRIEPAFDDPDLVRALFERHAPYRTIAEYIPRKPGQAALPYFRGNWAVGGQPLVDGAETILQNQRFIDAARALLVAQGSVPPSSW